MPEWVIPMLLILVGWAVVPALISLISGWRLLGEFYRATQPHSGERFRFQSAQLRWMIGYNNCLTVEADTYGICLSVFFPLKSGHPSLFVPWEDISVTVKRRLWFSFVELRFAKCPSIPFAISKKLADSLVKASGKQLEIESESPLSSTQDN